MAFVIILCSSFISMICYGQAITVHCDKSGWIEHSFSQCDRHRNKRKHTIFTIAMGYQITVFILRWHTVMPTTETATHSTVPLKMNRKRTPVNTLVMLRVRGMVNIIIVFKRAHTIRFSCFSRRSLFRRRSHTFRRAATPGIYIGPALFQCRMSVCVRQRVFVCVWKV